MCHAYSRGPNKCPPLISFPKYFPPSFMGFIYPSIKSWNNPGDILLPRNYASVLKFYTQSRINASPNPKHTLNYTTSLTENLPPLGLQNDIVDSLHLIIPLISTKNKKKIKLLIHSTSSFPLVTSGTKR